MKNNPPADFYPVLTIAGSDNSGGAGIQADTSTFMAFGCHGLSAITAVTAQNSREFFRFETMPPELVYDQIKMCAGDMTPLAIKTGMLASVETIKIVARSMKEFQWKRLVIDPVLKSSTGSALVEHEFVKSLVKELLPLADFITPNAPEAEILTGIKIESYGDVDKACKIIHEMGAKNVVLKGGHLNFDGDYSVDTLFTGRKFERFSAPKNQAGIFHGTGCAFSAALCACLAKGLPVKEAVQTAKDFVVNAMKYSRFPGYLNHGWNF